MIDSAKREEIFSLLNEIEEQEDIRILYACESGSRAWGFPSVNSDYDIRFLYIRPVEWYLSIDERRDVIEFMDGDLDGSGWDIKKMLNLFRKSNPPLMEWLGSPVVYREKLEFASKLRALRAEYYSPMVATHSYLKMSQMAAKEYLKGDHIQLKKTFYALRPLLAIQWIEQGRGVVPTLFQTMVDALDLPSTLKKEITDLVEYKRHQIEKDHILRIPAISDFIDAELARHDAHGFDFPIPPAPLEPLNDLFREALKVAWA